QNVPREAPGERDEREMRSGSLGGIEVRTTRVDLNLAITDTDRDLFGGVNYSRDLFEQETIGRLMSHYLNLLRGIVEDSEKPISELSLLSHQEREQIVMEWNQMGRPYPNNRRIHELFREQAERTPEQMALICQGEQLSYRELNRRANQLAAYLQGLGVG